MSLETWVSVLSKLARCLTEHLQKFRRTVQFVDVRQSGLSMRVELISDVGGLKRHLPSMSCVGLYCLPYSTVSLFLPVFPKVNQTCQSQVSHVIVQLLLKRQQCSYLIDSVLNSIAGTIRLRCCHFYLVAG